MRRLLRVTAHRDSDNSPESRWGRLVLRCALILAVLALTAVIGACSTLNTSLPDDSDQQRSSQDGQRERRIRVPPTIEDFEAGRLESPHLIE